VIVLRNVVVKLTLSFLKGAKAPTPKVDKKPKTGAQPALHFGGGNFHELSMTSSCLFNRGTTLSQTVTDMFFSQHFLK